jgi:hypothetical protein
VERRSEARRLSVTLSGSALPRSHIQGGGCLSVACVRFGLCRQSKSSRHTAVVQNVASKLSGALALRSCDSEHSLSQVAPREELSNVRLLVGRGRLPESSNRFIEPDGVLSLIGDQTAEKSGSGG